jgi:hypothetical protein
MYRKSRKGKSCKIVWAAQLLLSKAMYTYGQECERKVSLFFLVGLELILRASHLKAGTPPAFKL